MVAGREERLLISSSLRSLLDPQLGDHPIEVDHLIVQLAVASCNISKAALSSLEVTPKTADLVVGGAGRSL